MQADVVMLYRIVCWEVRSTLRLLKASLQLSSSALHCRICVIGMKTCFKHLNVMP